MIEGQPINVELVKGKTISYILGALNNSKGHAGELLSKTKDFEGYERLIKFIDEFKETVIEFEENN